MHEIHMSPGDLMAARNGTTAIVRTADWNAGIEVAFDVEGGEMAPLDNGIARVMLSPDEFQAIADDKGAGYEVKADDGTACRISVWA